MPSGNLGGDDILQLFVVYRNEPFDVVHQKADSLFYFGTHGSSYAESQKKGKGEKKKRHEGITSPHVPEKS
jgi:hypothetical protein